MFSCDNPSSKQESAFQKGNTSIEAELKATVFAGIGNPKAVWTDGSVFPV
jgi:hypothetical protein